MVADTSSLVDVSETPKARLKLADVTFPGQLLATDMTPIVDGI